MDLNKDTILEVGSFIAELKVYLSCINAAKETKSYLEVNWKKLERVRISHYFVANKKVNTSSYLIFGMDLVNMGICNFLRMPFAMMMLELERIDKFIINNN